MFKHNNIMTLLSWQKDASCGCFEFWSTETVAGEISVSASALMDALWLSGSRGKKAFLFDSVRLKLVMFTADVLTD